MEEADPKTAAEVSLMMEQEIDKRVAEALEKIFNISRLPSDDPLTARITWVNTFTDTLMTDYEFQRRVAGLIATKLRE